MVFLGRENETICAVSTPQGRGGISVIRISGKQARASVQSVFQPFPKNFKSHRAYYGHFLELESKSETSSKPKSNIDSESEQIIDEVIVTYFEKGKSFTGEETIEISCHGNPLICDSILRVLQKCGCKIALPGEFTYRAFMNERIDLIQAEAVLSLIEGRSHSGLNQALKYLSGDLSAKLKEMTDQVTHTLAHLEASIDFAAEGIEPLARLQISQALETIEAKLSRLIAGFGKSRGLRDGFRVLLSGFPNVGKSSLFNQLCGDQKAIVTEIPGTTRDLLEADYHFEGSRYVVFDSAGLRSSTLDQIEAVGIGRAKEQMNRVDLILYICNKDEFDSSENINNIKELLNKDLNIAVLFSKQDLGPWSLSELSFFDHKLPALNTSAQSEESREILQKFIADQLDLSNVVDHGAVFTARQREAADLALSLVRECLAMDAEQVSTEILSVPLLECLKCLQSMIGEVYDDQVLDRVFKEFCLGK